MKMKKIKKMYTKMNKMQIDCENKNKNKNKTENK